MEVASTAASEAVDAASESGEAEETLESAEGAEAEGAHRTELGEAESTAQIDGWSIDAMMGQADEVLGPTGLTELQVGDVTETVSLQEAAIYDQAGLRGEMVEGRACLVRDDIDLSITDDYGRTNLERMADGNAPLDAEGREYELHHVQQENDGILAELTASEHRGPGNDGVLHDRTGPSEIDREAFPEVRADHWRARAAEMGEAS